MGEWMCRSTTINGKRSLISLNGSTRNMFNAEENSAIFREWHLKEKVHLLLRVSKKLARL
jgi:hypothetical protein